MDSYFCAPVQWFGHFSCVIFCTFVAFLVHFCVQVQQCGHFSNFLAITFFCTFACCTTIFFFTQAQWFVHFCQQVQQFGHFCNFPAVTFFCAFACCTSIFVDRRKGLATFSILHQFFTILEFSTLGPLKLSRLSAKMDVQHAKAQKNVTAGKLQKWPNCSTCTQKWTRQTTNVQKTTHEKWSNHCACAQK